MATIPIGELVASLGLDTKQVEKNLNKVEKELKDVEKQTKNTTKNMGNSFDMMAGKIGRAAAAFLSFQAVKAGVDTFKQITKANIDTAASFEQMAVKLDKLTKGAGQKTLNELNAWALEMPVNTKKAVESFTLLKAMGLDPTIKTLETLTDVASIFGEETLQRLALQLGQASAKGRIMAQDLNIMAEAGINARQYLSNAFGMTIEEIQKSSINIRDILNVIFEGMSQDFGGAAREMMGSWAGLDTVTKSYIVEIQKLGAEKGSFDNLKKSVEEYNEYLRENKDALADAVNAGNDLYAGFKRIGTFLASTFTPGIQNASLAITDLFNIFSREKSQGIEKIRKEIEQLQKQYEKIRKQDVTDPKLFVIASTIIQKQEKINKLIEDQKLAELADDAKRAKINMEELATQAKRAGEFTKGIEIPKEFVQFQENLAMKLKELTGNLTFEETELYNLDKAFKAITPSLLKAGVAQETINELQAEYTAEIKRTAKELAELEKLIKRVESTPQIGDTRDDLRADRIFGEEALRKMLVEDAEEAAKIMKANFEEIAYQQQELGLFSDINKNKKDIDNFSALLANNIADSVKIGLTEGFTSAGLFVSNLLASTLQATLATEIGGVAGGIAGGAAGFGIAALGSAIFGGGSPDAEIKQRQILREAIERNTEAIERNTEFLQNEISSFSRSVYDLSESFIDQMDQLSKDLKEVGLSTILTGGTLAGEFPATSVSDISDNSIQSLRDFIDFVNTGYFTDYVYANEDLAESYKNIIKPIENYIVKFELLQDSIIDASSNMLEDAGDAFRSAAEIQKRDFGKTAKDLITGLIETFVLEGTLGEGAGEYANALDELGVSWQDLGTILLSKLTPGTKAYEEALTLVNTLVATATLNEKARAEALRDSLSSTFDSVYDIFNDLAFRSSGLSRQEFVQSRIEDYKKIFDEVGSLTEDQFSGLTSYVVEWYNAAIQAEEQAASLWNQVADRVETLSNSIQSTIRSIQLGSLNVNLGKQKVSFASGEYQKLLESAKTGDEAAINEFIGFSQQYLQVAQDTYKSSEAYRSIYETVMKDLGELNDYTQSSDYQQLLYDLAKDELDETALTNNILEKIRTDLNTLAGGLIDILETSSGASFLPDSSQIPSAGSTTGSIGNITTGGAIQPVPSTSGNGTNAQLDITNMPSQYQALISSGANLSTVLDMYDKFLNAGGLNKSYLLESSIMQDYANYFKDTSIGNVIPFLEGTLEKINSTTARYTRDGGGSFNIDRYGTIAEVAARIPELAESWKNTYGIADLSQFNLPGYAKGGIAYTPQIATLAENGPEVVLDKSKFDRMTDSKSQVLNIYLGNELIDKRILKAIDNNNVIVKRRNGVPGRVYL